MDVVSESSKGYGAVYVEYRAWLQTLTNEVNFISDVGELDTAIVGALDPDNPLKWGVFKALENSNGTSVGYTAVSNPARARLARRSASARASVEALMKSA